MFRALIGERFPDHVDPRRGVRRRRGTATGPRATAGSSIPSTARPTTRTVCRSSAAPARSSIDGQPMVAAVYDPSRRELFTAERGAGRLAQRRADARLVGRDVVDRRAAVHRISLHGAGRTPTSLVALFGEFLSRARAVRRLGSAAIDLCYVAAGRFDGFWEQKLQPVGRVRGRAARRGGGRTRDATSPGGPFDSRLGEVVASNGRIHAAMVETIQGFKAGLRSRNWTK